MKCLVTGSTGFIGRRLMKHLFDQYPASDITCLVKPAMKPREGEALTSYRTAGVQLIEGDLTRPFVSGTPPTEASMRVITCSEGISMLKMATLARVP